MRRRLQEGWRRESDYPTRTPVNIVTRAQINGPVLHVGESEQTGILSMPRHIEIESKHDRLSRPFISIHEQSNIASWYYLILSKKKDLEIQTACLN